ncbi:MAG TPA: zinc-binding dehydrogenase [Polyangiaceae bacterium]|nr:zinc-binding dehydrogenase [Polyangiaceae bacterium]
MRRATAFHTAPSHEPHSSNAGFAPSPTFARTVRRRSPVWGPDRGTASRRCQHRDPRGAKERLLAQGSIGLCSTIGAKLMGASLVIGVDGDETRLEMARRMGADVVIDYRNEDVVARVKSLTGGGVDVAIEALGTQQTFETCLRSLRPGGTLSSLGVYSGKLQMPYDAFAAGLGDHRIVTTLCPGGKERIRRLMELVRTRRIDLTPLITHRFTLDEIQDAYAVFGERRQGVIKVALRP